MWSGPGSKKESRRPARLDAVQIRPSRRAYDYTAANRVLSALDPLTSERRNLSRSVICAQRELERRLNTLERC